MQVVAASISAAPPLSSTLLKVCSSAFCLHHIYHQMLPNEEKWSKFGMCFDRSVWKTVLQNITVTLNYLTRKLPIPAQSLPVRYSASFSLLFHDLAHWVNEQGEVTSGQSLSFSLAYLIGLLWDYKDGLGTMYSNLRSFQKNVANKQENNSNKKKTQNEVNYMKLWNKKCWPKWFSSFLSLSKTVILPSMTDKLACFMAWIFLISFAALVTLTPAVFHKYLGSFHSTNSLSSSFEY